jgi:hypothetical protein
MWVPLALIGLLLVCVAVVAIARLVAHGVRGRR